MDAELSRPLTKADLANYDKLRLKWKELSVEDIILDGLYINSIRLVKEYFEKVLKMDLKPNKIKEIGLKSVLQLLADKDLRGAETLLSHMDFDFTQKIYQICFFTPYKQLRDYLINVLIDRANLNEKELEIIEYLKRLESLYESRSFTASRKLVPAFQKLDVNWRGVDVVNKKNDYFQCKELVTDKTEMSNKATSSNRYSHVVVEWIRDWPVETRRQILINSIILSKELAEQHQDLINPGSLWAILLEENQLKLILEWVDYSYQETAESSPSPLFKEKLTPEMIDSIYTSRYLLNENREQILNCLARYNVFCSEERNDIRKYVRRLSSALLFFDAASFSKRDDNFHLKIIANFLNKNSIPASFLWYYLDFYNSTHTDKNSQTLLAESQLDEFSSSKCLRMMQAFRQNINLAEQTKWFSVDSSSYFSNICLKNFEYSQKVDNLQISHLFAPKYKEFHLLALAMSLYFDLPLSTNESAKLEHLLDQYPAIRLIIDSKSTSQPVSLYALLQEWTKFDVSKCFMWQKSNTICLFKQEEKSNSKTGGDSTALLSFENADFSRRHGYKDSLDYSFFIKQGRPFYAYHYFINSQLKKYHKINKTLIEEARLRSNLIMIENFTNSRIVSSCVAFSDLIDSDTFKLKLNTRLMHILNEHYKKHGMDEKMAEEKCKNLFIEFFKGEIEPKRMVTLFEHVLVTLTTEKFDLKNMFTMEACSLWLPLMCFCKVYNLPYSCRYLYLCAESNNWLMFLIFAQLYQIPRYQVTSGLEYFTDTGLKQHLDYALHNVITTNSANESILSKLKNQTKKTESRFTSIIAGSSNWFKNKRKKKPIKSDSGAKSSTETRRKSNDSSENEESFDFDESMSRQGQQLKETSLESIDFYELLITCQNSPDPVYRLQLEALRWQTPVLAVFATFYPHDRISCLCTFLYSSMRIYQNVQKQLANIEQKAAAASLQQQGQKSIALFGLSDLKEAIQIVASKSYLRTLLNSVRIFIPRTILDIYVEFLYNVYVTKDPIRAQKLYSNYKYELIKVTLSKYQSFIPLEWYEEVISKLTRITILKCHTIEDLQNLTNILGANNEYRRLIKLVHTLKSNKIGFNLEEWLDMNDKSEQFGEICFKAIEELLKMQKFNEAEELADYCELSKDRIHLARIGRQIEILRLNNDFDEILEFWRNAHVQLLKIGIKDTDFIDFLKFQSSRSNIMLERIVLLNLICQLCPNDSEASKNLFVLLFHFVVEHKKKNEINNLREIFKKMLLFGRLKEDPVKELIENVVKEGRVNDFTDCSNLNEQDKEALNILLYNLVEIGKLNQAYVIAKYFKYYNQDFRILLNMIYICLDMIKPEELDYNSQSFDTASFQKIRLTNVLRSMSRVSESDESIRDKAVYLEKLVGLCNYGNKFSKRIKLDFLIANEILNINFLKLMNENEWNLLKMVLYSNHAKKFDIAKEFVHIYDMNASRLCDFILDEFTNTLNACSSFNKSNSYNNTATMNTKPSMLDPFNNEQFSSLIKIFGANINMFGTRLLNKSRSWLNESNRLMASNSLNEEENFLIPTELLIRSHDCFIQSCSMEGISNVLQTCKVCANRLEKAGEFNMMIRLLTGIAHFSEMTYIMDYLWNNHQFEMLFGKGTGKEDKLRLALLDYLKRYHPNDNETYTMVTLNFTMHREIATMLEEAAYQQLKILENKKLENTSECLTDLQSILQYFSDAAQSYMKQDCVKQTESCIKKARLIALQIQFLSSNVVVINLSSHAASKFIVSHSRFWEALIVSEAYEKKSDWPQALFNQFILNGNEKYLLDFKNHLQLGSSIIEEVANRCKLWLNESTTAATLPPQSEENMKKLLRQCKELTQFYRLAVMLDFKDLVDELHSKRYSCVIKDLISNKKL